MQKKNIALDENRAVVLNKDKFDLGISFIYAGSDPEI